MIIVKFVLFRAGVGKLQLSFYLQKEFHLMHNPESFIYEFSMADFLQLKSWVVAARIENIMYLFLDFYRKVLFDP